jgi:hypothetical protein
MRKEVYTMKRAPGFVPVKRREDFAALDAAPVPQVIAVDRATECHVTPPDVAARMVRYLGRVGDFQTLEPSAGTGNLAQALLDSGHSPCELTLIERHHKLCATLYRFKCGIWNRCFLEYAAEATGKIEFARIIMNPPFKAVRQHIAAARGLLGRDGHDEPARLVALVPVTFDAPGMQTLEHLPADTFANAQVHTKLIRFETD